MGEHGSHFEASSDAEDKLRVEVRLLGQQLRRITGPQYLSKEVPCTDRVKALQHMARLAKQQIKGSYRNSIKLLDSFGIRNLNYATSRHSTKIYENGMQYGPFCELGVTEQEIQNFKFNRLPGMLLCAAGVQEREVKVAYSIFKILFEVYGFHSWRNIEIDRFIAANIDEGIDEEELTPEYICEILRTRVQPL